MLPSSRREINEYLFYEFGFDLNEDEGRVSETWPFELEDKGSIRVGDRETFVYEFMHGDEAHYALDGEVMEFVEKADMSLDDLRLEEIGACWIGRQQPLDLHKVVLGEGIPSTADRSAAIEQLAGETLPKEGAYRVIEGLYFKDDGSYLGLVEREADGEAYVVGTGIEPCRAPFPKASAWRRLVVAVGTMVETGRL